MDQQRTLNTIAQYVAQNHHFQCVLLSYTYRNRFHIDTREQEPSATMINENMLNNLKIDNETLRTTT